MSRAEHNRRAFHDESAEDIVVIGMSAGGLTALRELILALPAPFPAAVIVAQHAGSAGLPNLIGCWSAHEAVHAASGQRLQSGRIYVCPPKSHITVNANATITVSSEPPIRFVRPSIDWLLESVAAVYKQRAVAVLLSGSNEDGVRGAQCVVEAGGTVIAQDPLTCAFPQMPLAVIRGGTAKAWAEPGQIPTLLRAVARRSRARLRSDPFASDARRAGSRAARRKLMAAVARGVRSV